MTGRHSIRTIASWASVAVLSPAVVWVALRTGGTGLLGAMVAAGTVSVIALARGSRRPVSRRRGVWQALTPMVVVVAVWDSATLIAEVAHDDAGDLGIDLSWVSGDATVAALRDQYGADMVSLIVENGAGFCGMGYVQRSVGPGFASSAFQVTARSCAVGNLSLAHEHGHNLGMEHDPANGPAPSSASYPWSFGHYVSGVYRTVMSYPSPCGCSRVAYFSNPNVIYSGSPTGLVDQRDNARTANSTVSIVAAFRPKAATTPPNSPSGLTANAAGTSQINLAWTDGSSDETGFEIERSTDGGVVFTLLTTTGANVTSYSNTGLPASSTFHYRVRAINGGGNSSYTNVAFATTATPAPPSAPQALVATAVSSSQINLTWTDTASNETGFKIERSTDGVNFSPLTTVGAGVTATAAGVRNDVVDDHGPTCASSTSRNDE